LRNSNLWCLGGFALWLTLASLRAYQYPEYSTDGFSYMANAVAMSGASIQTIHDTVYQEARAGVPGPVYAHLTGNDQSESAVETSSFHQREINPYRFAEFLPCFAIRPIFNESVYVLHYWFGVGLLKAVVLIPVLSYWLMGWIVLAWMCRYVALPSSAMISALLLVSPPLWELARSTTPDALSSLAVLSALFLLFEQRRIFPGTILLLVSVWIRTDNVVLVLLTLICLYMAGFGIRLTHVAVLAAVAVASVVLINHFSGDYGPKVLYYRSFIQAPVAVGEIVPVFGMREYLHALRMAAATVVHGSYIPFFLISAVGVLRQRSRTLTYLVGVTVVYTVAHLIIFPNPETRFFGPFFVAAGLALATTLSSSRQANRPSQSDEVGIQAHAAAA
jgi:hypothetical protein